MKKSFFLLLIVAIVATFGLVSCKNEIQASTEELVDVSFEQAVSRALSATLEPFDPTGLYWKYAAMKNEADGSGLNSGATGGLDVDHADWIKTGPSAGLGTVQNFSQGLWDFALFAYKKDGTNYNLVYSGVATAVRIVKGGSNTAHVVVSPVPSEDKGTLVIGATSLDPFKEGDTSHVERYVTVTAVTGGDPIAPTSTDTYNLPANAYKVTVTYKMTFDTDPIVFAEGTVIATVYPNLTTTVTGSVDELVTYAEFEAESAQEVSESQYYNSEDSEGPYDLVFALNPANAASGKTTVTISGDAQDPDNGGYTGSGYLVLTTPATPIADRDSKCRDCFEITMYHDSEPVKQYFMRFKNYKISGEGGWGLQYTTISTYVGTSYDDVVVRDINDAYGLDYSYSDGYVTFSPSLD